MSCQKIGYAEFFEGGNTLADKIEIRDSDFTGKLYVEYTVRVPKDPRGFKRVVTKSGTWSSSEPEKAPVSSFNKDNYDRVTRCWTTIVGLNFDNESACEVSLADDQFVYQGKTFKLGNKEAPQFL